MSNIAVDNAGATGGSQQNAREAGQAFGPATEFFLKMLQEEEALAQNAREASLKHFDEVDRFIRLREARYAPLSRALLIELRTGNPKPDIRRDGTSAYDHEMTQALIVIWQYENRDIVRRYVRSNNRQTAEKGWPDFLRNTSPEWEEKRRNTFLYRTRRQADLGVAIAMNHDSIEDLGLRRRRLRRRLMRACNAARRDVACICDCIVAVSKKRKDEPVAIWGRRAGRTVWSLATKYNDRMTNLATMIGSKRSEDKIREYIDETKQFIRMHPEKVLTNGTLSYMAEYLEDQCNLLTLYLDFKQCPAECKNRMLSKVEEAIYNATNDYSANSIDSHIHPMMSIVRRILADPEVTAAMSNQPLSVSIPVAELSAPLGADRPRPKVA